MDETRLELKVGALILLAIAGALALLWLMGELTLGSTGRVAVEFGHTGNVVKGAPVKLGGVQVGKVERITLTPDRRDATGDPPPGRMDPSGSPAAGAALQADPAGAGATHGPPGAPPPPVVPGPP